jgi:PAS domain S-box-containing protein
MQTVDRGTSRKLTDFLLADIVGIAADAIICIDESQRITLFNEGAETIFGWTADEVIGRPLEVLLPERVREVHRTHIEKFRQAPERSRKMGQRQEISGIRKNGEEFPAEAAIAKVSMGGAVVFSVVLRDITEQVELQKRLQRAVSARDEIAGVVAHDLRNPVSAVKMLSSALMRWAAEHDVEMQPREQLSLIREAALQMDRLIQDLLDITRVESGRFSVDPQPLTTIALLEGSLRTLRPLVEDRGLALKVDLPSSLPMVSADPERIGQLLSNLIGNAIKATTKGCITVSASEAENEVHISVSDTGTGIPREHLAHLFDRYWRAPSNIRTRGAGLGLPIARGIVQAHGGRLWVESEPGQGSTFHFTLPVASAAAVDNS